MDLLPDGGHFFNPADSSDESFGFVGRAFHLSLSGDKMIDSLDVDHFLMALNHMELQGDNKEFDSFAYASRVALQDCARQYIEYLGYHPIDIIRKTLERTTQFGKTILHFLMRRHVKARFP